MGLCVRTLLLTTACAMALGAAEPAPVPLFDGTTFAGWEGDTTRTWRIEDGILVAGRPGVPQPANDFLASTREYEDFDLTFEYCNRGWNGGMQFRSQRVPGSPEMSGYQADLSPKLDGNLYDESRRMRVLAQPTPEVRAQLEISTWNRYRIRAEGPRIRLWVNGIQTVDYTEEDPSIPRRGFLGLQIHQKSAEIRYRNLQIVTLGANP